MKKILALLLVSIVMLSLASCGDKTANSNMGTTGFNKGSSSKTQILSVVHPEFQLTNGFIEPVAQLTEAPENFIPLSTEEDFDKIRLNPSANYILMADMDLSQIDFETIDPDKGFSGILDGNGYTVSHVKTTLFDYIHGGVIRNLKISGNLQECNSSLARRVKNGVISNCSFSGSIQWFPGYDEETTNGAMGGLISEIEGTCTYSCYNEASISGDSSTAIGGITGKASDNCTILNCFNTGSLTGQKESSSTRMGGIVGFSSVSNESSIYIAYCYNAGTMQNSPRFTCSGILGFLSAREGQVTIDCCYNTGNIGENGNAIAYVEDMHKEAAVTISNCYGYSEDMQQNMFIANCQYPQPGIDNVLISNCYNIGNAHLGGISMDCKNLQHCYYLSDDEYDQATKDGALFTNVKGLTLEEMQKQDSFTGFNFESTWQMGKRDYPYPVFRATDYRPENGIG